MIYGKLLWILFGIALSGALILSAEWKATPKIVPKDYPIIVWCINEITHEIRSPLNQTYSACYHGTKWWKNLRFPSKKQMELMGKTYDTHAKIVTAMTLINHESQFDSKAKWCHKWWCDYWLFQIRDSNGWAKMSDLQQMEWFKNRKAWQLSSKGNCYKRVQEWNRENLLRCVFARHHWDRVGTAPYPSGRYEEWKFYNTLNF